MTRALDENKSKKKRGHEKKRIPIISKIDHLFEKLYKASKHFEEKNTVRKKSRVEKKKGCTGKMKFFKQNQTKPLICSNMTGSIKGTCAMRSSSSCRWTRSSLRPVSIRCCGPGAPFGFILQRKYHLIGPTHFSIRFLTPSKICVVCLIPNQSQGR